jgi:hypothetical protein
MILNSARTDKQASADLSVREPLLGKPGDLSLLRGQQDTCFVARESCCRPGQVLQESRLADTGIPVQNQRTTFTTANGPDKTINGRTFGRTVSQPRGTSQFQVDRLASTTGFLDIELRLA